MTFDFDFTNGINWELYWLAQDNEETEPTYKDGISPNSQNWVKQNHLVVDKGIEDVSIRYKSTIKFNDPETAENIAVSMDEFFDIVNNYETRFAEAQKKVTDAQEEYQAAKSVADAEKTKWEASAEYKAWKDPTTGKEKLFNDIKNDAKNKLAELKAMDKSQYNGNYTKTLGKITSIYSAGSTSNSTKVLYLWLKANNCDESKQSGAEWDKVKAELDKVNGYFDTYKTDLGALYDTYKNAIKTDGTGELWNLYVKECKALIAQDEAKAVANDPNKCAAYKTYSEKQAIATEKQNEITALQAEVDEIKYQYSTRCYINLNDYKKKA